MRRRTAIAPLREYASRFWGWLRRRRTDEDLEQELRSHLEMAAEAACRQGEPPEGARRAARLSGGGLAQSLEALRDQRGLPWLDDAVRDLRYAARLLLRNPGFAAVSVVSMAIGIGANCAVFSFADALLLRPLAIPNADSLVTVGSNDALQGALVASYRELADLQAGSRSFESLAGFTNSVVGFAATPDATPRLAFGNVVSGNFFRAIGIEPQLGRDFRPDEDQVPGRDAVVILGHDFWQRQFGGDPAVVGRSVRLNGLDFVVIGVAPAGFTGLTQYNRYEFYIPLAMWPRLLADADARPLESRTARQLTIKARLKPGVTLSQAQSELDVIGANLERAYPESNRGRRFAVRTELQNRIANAPPLPIVLGLLTALAAAVLFVACANVAGLLASRAPVRSREIAMRIAIGAGRSRVIRQLFTESLLIAMAGCGLGLGVGYAGVSLFRQFRIPTDLPISARFGLDRRALLVSVVVAIVSAVLFGLAPAVRAARGDLTAVIRSVDGGRFSRRRWGRAALVTAQITVSVVLLVVATFIYQGISQQIAAGPGFVTDRLLMMSLDPSQLRLPRAQTQQFFERLATEARQVPGIAAAALTRYMPMDGLPPSVSIVPEGAQLPAEQDSVRHATSVVDEGYFATIGLPIVAGRDFVATDAAGSSSVAIVNDVLAERYWPGQSAVGKRLRLDGPRGGWAEIVGIARTMKYSFAIEPPTPFVYLPYRQRPPQTMFLLVRATGDAASLATPLLSLVHRLQPDLPVGNVRTMNELYRMRSLVILNVVITLVASMGVMGLALAIVGLYGLVAYAATRRTREIGIRMAIGASRSDVLRMVMREGMVLALVGLFVGLLVSLGAGRVLNATLTVGPGGNADAQSDFLTLPLVATTVLVVTVLAAYVPAKRAASIDPTQALRHE